MKIKVVSCLLILLLSCHFTLPACASGSDVEKLNNTAKGLRELAQTKKTMAQNFKKESMRKQLLDGAAEDEKLAAQTEERAKEEAVFEKDPQVNSARLAEKKALDDLNRTNDEIEKIKVLIAKPANPKDRADKGEEYLKKMKEAGEKKAVLLKAGQKRANEEDKVRKKLKEQAQ